jgi:DNA polymerase Ligase (LigD)
VGGSQGQSLDPGVRRLAVPVEDHSLAAGDFEGVRAGQGRGMGAVIVWDEGAAELTRDEPGHLSARLHGSKLAGGFALTRTTGNRWILVKARDSHARPGSDIVAEQPAAPDPRTNDGGITAGLRLARSWLISASHSAIPHAAASAWASAAGSGRWAARSAIWLSVASMPSGLNSSASQPSTWPSTSASRRYPATTPSYQQVAKLRCLYQGNSRRVRSMTQVPQSLSSQCRARSVARNR